MHHDSPVAPLLENAARGMESAWAEIVKRYAPLVFSVCQRYGIGGADAQDVAGSVWLRLVSNLRTIREPEALPGWLLTTARHECLMLLRHKNRQIPTDGALFGAVVDHDIDASLIGDERRAAARAAFAALPPRDRQLLSMLFSDPPKPYKEISSTLGIPVGAIGPTRARCLSRARRTPAIAALLVADRPDGVPHVSHDLQSDRIAG
ncbi:MAG TPA: sigma-70 family RNA polymerase sigma factor [Actinophytocola sp.]|uniref:RNA polymerase sigma factor n=1 Tax=Actinophytocola sp. TaxID=1872138 RepID=UPI002DDC9F32|nr:sigma-70 family RNA polymerase sigma factor [Actinophytocola sp.]HEV2782538.1 sigma-70 family RNA polymerase sigma factor [Actinophytocola sp.]